MNAGFSSDALRHLTLGDVRSIHDDTRDAFRALLVLGSDLIAGDLADNLRSIAALAESILVRHGVEHESIDFDVMIDD